MHSDSNFAPAAVRDTLRAGEALAPMQALYSPNGRCALAYQNDGNLWFYRDNVAVWFSGTGHQSPGRVAMQPDGNLVVYNAGNHPVWSARTDGNPGSHLAVQDDGNVVIYRPGGGAAWASYTNARPASGDTIGSDEALYPGHELVSQDGRTMLTFQVDGNVVVYRGGRALWSSRTDRHEPGRLAMQHDGNLVAYDKWNTPLWSSRTDRNPGSRLVVQNDGNVVVYRPVGGAAWATNTVAHF
ncbi:curculin domain-containing protein [Antrihabitans stalactiti]|uniref:curculin domain-containing protein n=1 Tax=Antrihabitans stalactiti TaxID=2584121 RepID=UPI00146C464F|nr:curculin domain-containing protein [Antrihabitans stalactiti]